MTVDPPGSESEPEHVAAIRASTQAVRRSTWRVAGSRLGGTLNASSYWVKWLVLGVLIGVIAGTGALVFYEALVVATHLLLHDLVGYSVPTAAGEGGAAGSGHFARPWALPLVVGLGGLASGLLVYSFAPEAEGHGTDAAITAIHENPRGIRLLAVAVKIVASALTIGSGGSGGREGPTAQISAGFGSLMARTFDLSPSDGRIAVSVGIGSGIGAIFSAPLGGAVLAADIIYRDDFEFSAVVPGAIASIVAYTIFGAVKGFRPLFAVTGHYRYDQPIDLLWFAVIGVLAGVIGLIYSRSFYGVVRLSHRIPLSRKLRPAVGGVLVGLLGLGLPEVLGTGYGWVQKTLGPDLLHLPLYAVLALPLARILATSLSIGTGGSGGVFGPGMVIGAFTGAAVWRLLEPIVPSAVPHEPAAFVIVGMMACFGSIARAPIAVMLMVAEMTGTVSLLAPALVAVALATLIVRRADDSIYRSQLHTRADSPAARLHFGLPLIAGIPVTAVMVQPRLVLPSSSTVEEAGRRFAATGVSAAPVVDERDHYLGTVHVQSLEGQDPARPVARLLDATTTAVPYNARLDTALEAITQGNGRWTPVADGRRHLVGLIAIQDIVRGYKRALSASAGQIRRVTSGSTAIEEVAGPGSPLVGVPLQETPLPEGA
ncbi:MAG TPA: chloride channel protein, partial [Acidimicrobiales bacterium]|nr:chloride channel protein [Acidimicrobiales bacterium]